MEKSPLARQSPLPGWLAPHAFTNGSKSHPGANAGESSARQIPPGSGGGESASQIPPGPGGGESSARQIPPGLREEGHREPTRGPQIIPTPPDEEVGGLPLMPIFSDPGTTDNEGIFYDNGGATDVRGADTVEHDMTAVASGLVSDDPQDQRQLTFDFSSRSSQRTASHARQSQPVEDIRLSELADIYHRGDTSTALSLLKHRLRIVVDKENKHHPDDPDLSWSLFQHYLDFGLPVPREFGLSAILPNNMVAHNFMYSFNINNPHREWRAKYGTLGFDPTGRMLFAGYCGEMQVWLGAKPLDEEFVPDDNCDGSSRMSKKDYRRILMFWTSFLNTLGVNNISCESSYPNLDQEDSKFALQTNLLQRMPLELNSQTARRLHEAAPEAWDVWLEDSPPGWLGTMWTRSSPLIVAVRYGQNQEISQAELREQQARDWQQERDYSEIRYLSFSIATEMRCSEILGRRELTLTELNNKHGVVYTDDEATNIILGQDQLDELDTEADGLIPVFNANGRPLNRTIKRLAPNRERQCGLLMDFKRLPELFDYQHRQPEAHSGSDIDDDDAEGGEQMARIPRHRFSQYNLYPQAFLHDTGNFQSSSSGLGLVVRTAHDINETIIDPEGTNNEDDEGGPLHVVGCQGYNALSHRIRPNGGRFHEHQLGLVGGAVGGSHTLPAEKKAHSTFQRLRQRCEETLPQERYEQLVNIAGLEKGYRFEHHFVLDLDEMDPAKRSGSEIFKLIILELCDGWRDRQFVPMLKNSLVIFKRETFPHVYSYTSFGVTSAIKAIWEGVQLDLTAGRKVDPYTIEMLSILERIYSFGGTGSGRVLLRALMEPLSVLGSLRETGWPAFSNQLQIDLETGRVSILPENWPTYPGTQQMVLGSTRSMQLTYGQAVSRRYQAYAWMLHIATVPLKTNLYGNLDDLTQRIQCILDTSIKELVQDIIEMVTETVSPILNRQLAEGKNEEDTQLRLDNLKRWQGLAYPLAYANNAGTSLLIAISDQPGKLIDKTMTLFNIGSLLYSMGRQDKPVSFAAPIIKGGNFQHLWPVAVERIVQMLSLHLEPSAVEDRMATLIGRAFFRLRILFLPWSRPASGKPGRQFRYPGTEFWMGLGAVEPDSPYSIEKNNTLSKRTRTIQLAALAMEGTSLADCNAPWTANGVKLQDLHKYLDKRVPPEDWDIGKISLSPGGYVTETYQWVAKELEMRDPIHRLAIIMAIIFSKAVPSLGYIKPTAELDLSSQEAVTEAVQATQWDLHRKGSTKGTKQSLPYITMFSTAFIAYENKDSPLMKHAARQKSGGLGKDWTSKHSAKGITGFNMVRFGLAWGEKSIFSAPNFNSAWGIFNQAKLKIWGQRVENLLRAGTQGTYELMLIVFGEERARQLAQGGQLDSVPPIGTISRRIESGNTRPRKRRRLDPPSEEEKEV